MLCMELAEILRSGITAGEGFLIISQQESDQTLKEALLSLYESSLAGEAISVSMRRSEIFPEYMLRMLSVAEETGAIEDVLRSLSAYYDRQVKQRAAVKSAVGYPLLLLGIVLAVFFVFLTEVLPVFSRVFAQIGAQMLPVAQAFLSLGLWLGAARWWILGALGVLALAALAVGLIPALRDRFTGAVSRRVAKEKTGRAVTEARLASVLSLAVSGTTDTARALLLAADFAAGTPGGEKVAECARRVGEGESFAAAAAAVELLEPMYCRMLAVGERAGATDTILRDVARRTDEQMDRAVEKLTGRVEPITVLVLSVCVGLLLLGVMLPLVGIMSAL